MSRSLLSLWLGLTLWGCQSERWNLPTTLGGTPSRTHNYASTAAEPPQLLFLQELHHTDTSGCIQPPLPLSSRLTLLTTANGSLLAVSATGIQWSFRFPDGVTAGAALAADTTSVYVLGTNGMLYSFSFSGQLRWQKPILDPLLTNDSPYIHLLPFTDGVLVGDASGRLLRLSSNASVLWEHHRRTQLDRYPVADAQGNIILGAKGQGDFADDTIVFLEPNGRQRWARALSQTRLSCPIIVGDRLIVAAGLRFSQPHEPIPVLHALSETGTILWSRTLPTSPRWLSLDDSNNVYVVISSPGVGEPISGILCHSPQGHQRWQIYLRATVVSPLLLFRTAGILFALQKNGALGAYMLSLQDGSLRGFFSLEEAPPLLFQPAVTPDGSLLLGWSSRLGLLRLGEHPWQWLF